MAKSSTLFGQRREFSMQAPAIGGGSSVPTVQYSSGNAQALANFSRTLFGLSSQFEDQLDAQAEVEAQKEGAIAGMAGNTEEQSYETIRGRAYNKAMLESFVTSLDTRAMVGASRLEQQYYGDPVGLETALNDFFGGMADEVDKVAPGAGASFRARQAGRALPAVEAARDTKFKLTRQEADANLITHEAAIMGQIKKNSAGLFSDNPAQSSASSAALANVVGEYLRTYDAVDPVTGVPLFSADEKAKANVYIKDKITTEATLAWFDSQPDPVDAYMRAGDPDFKFNLNMSSPQALGGKPGVVGGVLSSKGWSPIAVAGILGHLKAESNFNTSIKGDGGMAFGLAQWHPPRQAQLKAFAARTGGDWRSLETQAAFVDFELKNGDPQSREAGRRLAAARTVEEAVDAFMFYERPAGFRADNPKGGHNYAGRLKNANEFWSGANKVETVGVPLREALTESAWNALDTEMRQRITFANSQADRQAKAEAKAIEEQQKVSETDITARIFAPGSPDPLTGEATPPIEPAEIRQLAYDGIISQEKAQAFIKAITTEKPDRSDPQVYQELQRRLWNGEDVQEDVLNAAGRLSQTDANQLLNKNDQLNRSGAGSFSTEETFYYNQLKDLIAPQGILASFDQGRQQRAFEALDEYRRRIRSRSETGEKLDDITRDIARRSVMSDAVSSREKMEGLIAPRFSVETAEKPKSVGRWIDINASKKQLAAALRNGRITEQEAQEQANLLMQWDAAQKQYADEQAKAEELKGR